MDTRLKFNRAAFQRILNNGRVQALVDQTAREIASRADAMYQGPRESTGRRSMRQGYEATTGRHGDYGGGRPVAYAHTHGIVAQRHEAKDKTLEKALGGGA